MTPNPDGVAGDPPFESLLNTLKAHPAPLLPPARVLLPDLTARIASLQLHPSLETLLHLWNQDLPSAHFLVRHMQAAPAWEGMWLHGVLHRIEGDMANALAWYADVCESEPFVSFYGDLKGSDDGLVKQHFESLPQLEQDELASPRPGESGAGDAKLPAQPAARIFVRAVQRFASTSKSSPGHTERQKALEVVSRAELDFLTEWCIKKFGTTKVEDASAAWTENDERTKEISARMVSGGEGYRKF